MAICNEFFVHACNFIYFAYFNNVLCKFFITLVHYTLLTFNKKQSNTNRVVCVIYINWECYLKR